MAPSSWSFDDRLVLLTSRISSLLRRTPRCQVDADLIHCGIW